MLFALALALSAPSVTSSPVRTDCVHDREAILALEFKAFDQTEGSGWRPLYHNGCYVEVAELLREWRARNGDATPSIISFHEAQMWGYAGRYDLAEPLFARAFRTNGSASAVTWNLYVGGNLAFLRRDRAGLEAAVAALQNVPKPAGWDSAVDMNGNPVSLPWPANLNVLQAMLRCWDEPYEIAAHCHIEDWLPPVGPS